MIPTAETDHVDSEATTRISLPAVTATPAALPPPHPGPAVGCAALAVLAWVLVVLALSTLLAGCSTRENATAAATSDVGIRAGAAIVRTLPSLAPEEQAAAIERVLLLLGASSRGLAPVIAQLSAGERLQIGWTPEQAAAEPARFAGDAAEQAGRAWSEAEANAQARDLLDTAGRILGTAIGNAAGGGISAWLGGGGLLTLLGTGLAALRSARQAHAERAEKERAHAALDLAVRYGEQASNAETDDDIRAARRAAKAAQKAAGVHDLIEARLPTRHDGPSSIDPPSRTHA